MPRPGPGRPEFPNPQGGKAILRRLFLDFDFSGRMGRNDYWTMFAIRAGVVITCLLLAVQASIGGEMYSGMDAATYPGMDGETYPGMEGEFYPPPPATMGAETGDATLLGLLAGLVMIWVGVAGVAQAARRLHDTGKSGWWNLIALIPYVGFFVLLFLLAQQPSPGENAYGPAPDA